MSSLFTDTQKFAYKINNTDFFEAIDISINFNINDLLKQYQGVKYTPYAVQDGERPDNVAQRFYNNSELDWIILMTNNIHNIYDEWPRSTDQFQKYIIQKYGSITVSQQNVLYHYNAKKHIIDEETYNTLPDELKSTETQYEYEARKNIQKGIIRILSSSVAKSISASLRNRTKLPVV
tara:strand:- start:928 stop:1461 length:534 start_codon:yes stop_codon:yes gene_type:complete